MMEISSPNQTHSTVDTLLKVGIGTAVVFSFCATDFQELYKPLENDKYIYECTSSTDCIYNLTNELMPYQENLTDMVTEVEIIQSFVNNLIENSKPSPLSFSKTVDDNFWDLA